MKRKNYFVLLCAGVMSLNVAVAGEIGRAAGRERVYRPV
jgi:hypothetical protein